MNKEFKLTHWTQIASNDAVSNLQWRKNLENFTKYYCWLHTVLFLPHSSPCFTLYSLLQLYSFAANLTDFKIIHRRNWKKKWVTGGGRRVLTVVHRRKLSPMIGDLVFRKLKLLHRLGNELLSRVLIWKMICRRKLSISPSPLVSLSLSHFLRFVVLHSSDLGISYLDLEF